MKPHLSPYVSYSKARKEQENTNLFKRLQRLNKSVDNNSPAYIPHLAHRTAPSKPD